MYSITVIKLHYIFITTGKLRVDANLRYLYTGEQKKLGAPRKYDGKFNSNDLTRLKFVKNLKPGVSLYTLDLLQKKYVLYLKVCSSLGQTLNYWVDWHLLKLAGPARFKNCLNFLS
ncbi:hypothetical protein [Microcoleus sp. S13_C3]|uniref:hypothetical protein n=1 Tax=Microcoleus sp. S13_C3 TaxID=3055409 RepID=UPI002FD40536